MKMKIVHLTTGLNTGGAEIMLLNLLRKTNRERFSPVVISLMDQGTLGKRIEALGIPVRTIGMQRGKLPVGKLFSLWKLLKREQPDLIQGWMYHGNFLALLMSVLIGFPPVVWGLHHTTLDPEKDTRSTLWVAKLCAPLSRWCQAIVSCSESTLAVHTALGYRGERMVVIPNGFDLEDFSPDPEARVAFRKELGLAQDTILIGLIARFDPQKDHRNFFQAAHLLQDHLPSALKDKVHFVLCGRDVENANKQISDWLMEFNLQSHVHLLGLRDDMPQITAALDVAASASSHGEAFPLIIGEAMACGVPCAVTDVGDSAIIVGETGIVVPPKNPAALSEAWQKLVTLTSEARSVLGMDARSRIQKRFYLSSIVTQYEELYEKAYTKANA